VTSARSPRAPEARAISWATALLGPLAVSALLLLFRDRFFGTNAAVVLVLPVLLAALIGGRRGGVVAAIVAAACFDFFFTQPYYSLTIDHHDDIETTVVLLVVGLVVGEVVMRARESRRVAFDQRRQVEQIRRVAELAAGRGPSGRLVSVVEHEIVALVGADRARFERPPFLTSLPRLGHGVVTIGDAPPGRSDDRDEHPGLAARPGPPNELELPVWGGGREIGRLVLVMPDAAGAWSISPDDRALAVALADQLGAVLAAASES
jgi:hypothetical protein